MSGTHASTDGRGCSTSKPSSRGEPSRTGGATDVRSWWNKAGLPREKGAPLPDARRARGRPHEKLRSVSDLWDRAFSRLFEELDLEEGWLSPRSQEHLVHLALWMPFERAVEMLAELTGVQTSEATARRRSYRVGEAALEAEAARARSPTPEVPEEIRKSKHIISPDGAMVPLGHGQWAQVKTVAGGRVKEGKPGEEVHRTHISSFSRMLDAAS